MNEVKRTMLVLCIIYLVLCLAALSAYLVLCIFHLVLCSEVLSALTIMLSCYSGTDTFVMSFIGESITIYGWNGTGGIGECKIFYKLLDVAYDGLGLKLYGLWYYWWN